MIYSHSKHSFQLQGVHIQNEQFSEEKGFILRYTEKEVNSFRRRIRTPGPWGAKRTIYHEATWLADECASDSVYQVQNNICCLQINQVYSIVIIWQIVNYFEHNAV